jgi:hypothetical protein
MKTVEITAITNFLLTAEIFFLAGRYFEFQKQVFSAAWWWNIAIFLLGTTTLIGGIDHGFFEVHNRPERSYITKINWGVLGILTFVILITISKQFFSATFQPFILGVGIVQLIVYFILLLRVNSFLLVILNNTPVMVMLLIINLLKFSSTPGSLPMIAGIIILVIASLVQAFKIRLLFLLDGNGLGHIILMVGVIFLFYGGLGLSTDL